MIAFTLNHVILYDIRHKGELKHIKVEEKNGRYLLQDVQFQSLDDLVHYYKDNEIPNKENVRHVRLLYPITDPNALPSPGRNDGRRGSSSSVGSGVSVTSTSSHGSGVRLPTRNNHSSVPTRPLDNKVQPPARLSLPNISDRPPQPLPKQVRNTLVNVSSGPKPPDHCYDYAQSPDCNRILDVKQQVRLMDDLCECGLPLKNSTLVMGWTVHRSTEPETNGRVFFVGPNNESCWVLPINIDQLLKAEQRLFIESVKQNTV